MKFKWLEIKNLASLKGEHFIDFESLSHDGLFSIVGPTGSGKSTILNAISLSLFGQVYKKSLIQTDLITLGTSRSYSKLAFTLYGKDYMALWESRTLKKDGSPLKNPIAIKELYEFDDGKKIPSKKNIEELLGLDFNQFTKTIILNQGEFAKFLMSSFSERKDILEKLCHLEDLKNLGKELSSEIGEINLIKNEKESTLKAYLSDFTPIAPIKETLLKIKEELTVASLKQKELIHQENLISQIEKISVNYKLKNESIDDTNIAIKEALLLYEHSEEKKFISERLFLEKKEELSLKTPVLTKKIKVRETLIQKKINRQKIATELAKLDSSLKEQNKKLALKSQAFNEVQHKTQQIRSHIQTKLSEDELRELINIAGKKSEYIEKHLNTTMDFLKDLKEINNELFQWPKLFLDIKNLERKKLEQILNKLENIFNDSLLKLMDSFMSHNHDQSNCPLCEQTMDESLIKKLKTRLNALKSNQNRPEIDHLSEIKKIHYSIEKDIAQVTFISSKFKKIHLAPWFEYQEKEQKLINMMEYNFDLDLLTLKRQLDLKTQVSSLDHDLALHQEQKKSLEFLIKQNQNLIKDYTHNKTMIEAEIGSLENDLGDYNNKDPEEILNNLQKETTQLENTRNKDLYEFTQSKEKLASLKEKKQFLEDQIKDFDMTYHHLRANIKSEKFPATIREVDHHFLTITLNEYQIKIKTYQDEINELSKRVGNFEQKIESLNIIKSKMADVKRELKELEDTLGPKMILSDLLSRDEFRNYVLKRVEDILITQANHELMSLCENRYKIIVKPSKSRINEFYILDRFKEGKMRKIETLSGGETFMASLAMAMGLSELSRGSTEINAFFIDEGFATLDEDALDDVMELLLRIKSRGKQVGVISHVQRLMERIPTSLILNKAHDGNSNIKMELGF